MEKVGGAAGTLKTRWQTDKESGQMALKTKRDAV